MFKECQELLERAKTPVLLVEDSKLHRQQIKKKFERSPFRLTAFDWRKDRDLYRYKSANPDQQIVILDLDLTFLRKGGAEAGLEFMREKLWPADRATFYVIFSRHKLGNQLGARDRVDPMWCYVEKSFSGEMGKPDETPLSRVCLARLKEALLEIREYCTPILRSPAVSVVEEDDALSVFARGRKARLQDPIRQLRRGVSESGELLQDLRVAAQASARLGRAVGFVGVGVFGSIGRLEKRESSDVEFAVFFCSESGGDIEKRHAVTIWNRMAAWLGKRRLVFEGEKWLKRQRGKVLTVEQVAKGLPNQYLPVVDLEELLTLDEDADPQLRRRHFQFLTEVRPVFNPDLLFSAKRALIEKGIGGRASSVRELIDPPYLGEVIDQFMLDLGGKGAINSQAKIKKFCLRTLNALSCRLWLAGLREFGENELYGREAWRRLFLALCRPGVVKLLEVRKWFDESYRSGDGASKVLQRLDGLIEEYLLLYGDLYSETGDLAGQRSRYARKVLEEWEAVIEACQAETEVFSEVKRQGDTWLLSVAGVKNAKERLRPLVG